jgi:soluble lytic murein transglycosylase-like protein
MVFRFPSSFLWVWLLLVPAAFARAEVKIYTFIDESGERHYTDQPDDNRYRLMVNPHRERTFSGARYDAKLLARASIYDPIIERAAASQAIEPNLLRAVIVVESGFNSRALSPRGAVGLMQLMPATARRFGASDLYDPRQNVAAGASYLRFLIDRFGHDLRLALAAYNAGEDAVTRSGGRIPQYAETQAYVPRVIGIYQKLTAQARPT